MTKDEHIKYWINSSKTEYKIMNLLFEEKQFVYSLFFGHLYLEKICKAIWIKNNNSNTPPFTHRLLYLLENIDTGLSIEQTIFLEELQTYQIKGRYPDYSNMLKKKTTFSLTEKYIIQIKNISKCLLKKV